MRAALASLAVVATLFRCLWLWQPERQLLLHQQHLLRAVEDRDWGRIEAALDAGYGDRWGHTRATALRDGREWLRQFFALTVVPGNVTARVTPGGGMVAETLVFDGTGTPLAQMGREEANALRAPFVFEWKHAGWRPWAWTLVRMDQPELQLRDGDL